MDYFIYCWKNLFNYDGRARRSEFGWFILFTVLLFIAIGLFETFIIRPILGLETTTVEVAQLLNKESDHTQYVETVKMTKVELLGLLNNIFVILSILPTIAVLSRRLHDLNKPAWRQIILWTAPVMMFCLATFIPSTITSGINITIILYCIFITLALFFQDGEPEDNKYGKSPKLLREDN